MVEITEKIRFMIDNDNTGIVLATDEYINPTDGLIHCRKCGDYRQTIVEIPLKGKYIMPRCICSCQKKALCQAKEIEKQQQRMDSIRYRRKQGLHGRCLYDYTFDNDNGQNPLIKKAHDYVEHWDRKNSKGLLVYGDVGTGKSFFAGCIANALIDRDIPVLMISFPTILNKLMGMDMFVKDRAICISDFEMYELLIIDDFSIEIDSKYVMEQIFTIIDCCYRSFRPMIIVTNLKLEEIKNPPDWAHAKIYDRILERCAPVCFSGPNLRQKI